MEGFSDPPMTGYGGSRPASGYPTGNSPMDRPMTGIGGSRPASGYPTGNSPMDRPMTGIGGSRPVSGLPGHQTDSPAPGAGSRFGQERPMTGQHFPMDDNDFPAQQERPMTTVAMSRPTTMAGRPGTSQPAEGAPWDDPVAEQWEAPLADPASGGSQPGGYDRPKTAGGSRPVSGFSSGAGDMSARPSTSAVRPASELDRPQTGAARSRPVTGVAESRSLGGSRPMTSISRPATGFQSHSAGVSRPMTGLSRPVSGAVSDSRMFGEGAQWEGGRPGTSGRPFTGAMGMGSPMGGPMGGMGGPPGTGFRPSTQAAPSRATMSRMGSGRPMTGAMEKIRVMNRPITQQGLSGMKTGGSGRSRMVQDKSYFMGLLRTKTTELRSEVTKLRRQADSLNQEQATYTTYDTRVKQMAGELLDHQAEMADYNVLVELINMDSDRSLVDGEFEELKHSNGKESLLVEKLFLSRKEKENEIKEIENQMEQERRLADTLVDSMPDDVRERYWALRDRNVQLQAAIEAGQQQVEALAARKNELDVDLAASPLKQEAATQYDKLSYMETKRAELLEEKNLRETPEQERERLLKQVKNNNQEMGTLERRIHELKAEITKTTEDLEIAENDLEDSNSDRNLKYRELRKREEEMQEFLRTYEETKATETQAVANGQTEVVRTLEGISRNLSHLQHLPSYTSKDLGELRENLSVKEGETAKSRSTLTDLGSKHQQLQANHQKIEALDDKVREEMKTLREKMAKMREEMVILADLPALKQQNEEKTSRLNVERVDCLSRQDATRQQLKEAELEYSALKGELDSMDAYIQLGILERRLASIEQNNYALLEFVSSKRSEVDYGAVRGHVMHTIYEHNKRLMEEAIAGRASL